MWYPADEAFLKAIDEGKIKGTRNPNSIIDSAKNIIDLVESSDKPYFLWEEPVILIKRAK